MKVYIDTNVYLHFLLQQDTAYVPLCDIAHRLFTRCVSCEFYIVISDLVIYELCRKVESKKVEELLSYLEPKTIKVTAAKGDFLFKSTLHKPDNAHLSCALRTGCDAIITDDKEFMSITQIPVFSSPSF
jgi:predicted nucleic acid-binding protein